MTRNGGYQIISEATKKKLQEEVETKKSSEAITLRYLLEKINQAQLEIQELEQVIHEYELELHG